MNDISVRRLSEQDLTLRVEWFNTPSVYQHMAVDVPISLAATQLWFSRDVVLNPSRYDVTFVDEKQDVVAMGGLTDIDFKNARAELYIVTSPKQTGRGIGTKCVQWVCNFGFGFHRLNRIFLYTMPRNDGARRLYERLGFRAEGVLRSHILHHGKFVDRHVYGMLRDDWSKQEWAKEEILDLSQI